MLRYTEAIRKEIDAEITPYALSILWLVSLNPGIGPTEIADTLKMPKGTVSRNILKLSKKIVQPKTNPQGKVVGQVRVVGLRLIEIMQNDSYDNRKKRVYLTQKGHKTLERLSSMLYI